jgi:hypothetical protein
MGIVFFCQSCGARFEVDARMAGKSGRCKKCGQSMSIPRAEQLASMVAMPALASAAVGAGVDSGAGAGAGARAGGSPIGSWLKAGTSKMTLAPITLDRMPIGQRRGSAPSPLDDVADSKPYVLAQPVRQQRGRAGRQDNVVLNLWRRQLGGIQKLLRKLNETLYLVSIPFIMIFLLGIAVRSRQMAWSGAAVVVLLNIGRLVSGAANLAVVPFRDGLNLSKMKKPLRRVIEPALMIGLVGCAFAFIPWLYQGGSETAKTRGLFGEGGSFEQKLQAELEKAKALEGEQPGAPARPEPRGLDGSRSGVAPSQTPNSGGAPQSHDGGVRGRIKDIGQRAREAINESQKQP